MSGSATPGSLLRTRNGVADDLPALLELESAFPGDRLSRRQLRYHLARRGRLRVIEDAAGVAGYSLVLRRVGSRKARLYSLVIAPHRRGEGIGGRLLDDAEHAARDAGATEMQLEVRADNAAAIGLYQRRGYQPTARRDGYYDDGESAICMARALTRA